MTIFIKPGLIVCERKRSILKGLAIVVGPAKRDGQFRICRWKGGQQHWRLPVTVGQEQLMPVDDWTAMPLTEAKRLSSAAYEWNYLVRAMKSAQGSIVNAARTARVDRSNFRRLLERHGLAKPLRPKRTRRRRRRSK